MNVIKELKKRISERLQETKNPCKSYKTEAAAEKAVAKVAQDVANHHAIKRHENAEPAHYVVFFHEELERWVGAIDLNELIRRDTMTGGYLGLASDAGFYTY